MLAFVVAGFGSTPARAEWVLSGFTGSAMTENTDLHVRQGSTSLTFHDVSFQGQDFESPIYYGGRLAYFLDRDKPGVGFGLEFFHAKAYLETGGTAYVTGTRNGVPVNDTEPISNTVQEFNNSHGLNFLTADVLYRWVFCGRDKSILGRIQPYAGAGIGLVIPHVESTVDNVHQEEYQIHGPGIQAIAGINFDITSFLSIFGEYKFTYADMDESIPDGSIHFEPLTNHLIGGVSLKF